MEKEVKNKNQKNQGKWKYFVLKIKFSKFN